MKSKSVIYRELNLLSPTLPTSPSSSSWFKQIRQFWVDVMFQKDELKVWQSKDHHGQIWWYAHDPVTGQSACFPSEAEMCIWVEQHYRSTQQPSRKL